jgi:hypothetical protein
VIFLTAPFLVRELVAFFENSPAYVRRLQVLTSDPARPWLRMLVGEGLGHAEQSLGELAALAVTWLSSVVVGQLCSVRAPLRSGPPPLDLWA